MGLYKKEVLVRPTSTANLETAMAFSVNWLNNTFQEVASNKDTEGNYIDYFFADVFFAPGHETNSGQLWRVYATPCGVKYSMTPSEDTGRIEFMISDIEGQEDALEELDEAINTTLDENNNSFGEYISEVEQGLSNRIDDLSTTIENMANNTSSSTVVEATVI